MISYTLNRQLELCGEYFCNQIGDSRMRNIGTTIFKVAQAFAAALVLTSLGAASSPLGASIGFGAGMTLMGIHVANCALRLSGYNIRPIHNLDLCASIISKFVNIIGVALLFPKNSASLKQALVSGMFFFSSAYLCIDALGSLNQRRQVVRF